MSKLMIVSHLWWSIVMIHGYATEVTNQTIFNETVSVTLFNEAFLNETGNENHLHDNVSSLPTVFYMERQSNCSMCKCFEYCEESTGMCLRTHGKVSAGSKNCAQCTTDLDCMGNYVCDSESSKECVQCITDAHCEPLKMCIDKKSCQCKYGLLSTDTTKCKQCLPHVMAACSKNERCSEQGMCIECVYDTECPLYAYCFKSKCRCFPTPIERGQVASLQCQPGCLKDVDCRSSDQYCFRSKCVCKGTKVITVDGKCVDCVSPKDCPDNSLCNAQDNTCFQTVSPLTTYQLGVILGIAAVTILVFLALLAISLIYYRRRRQEANNHQSSTPSDESPQVPIDHIVSPIIEEPPPSYEAVVEQCSDPPTYEEFLASLPGNVQGRKNSNEEDESMKVEVFHDNQGFEA